MNYIHNVLYLKAKYIIKNVFQEVLHKALENAATALED